MKTFLALYRGDTLSDARLLAVSVDPALVAEVVAFLESKPFRLDDDPVLRAIKAGQREGLRLLAKADGHESEWYTVEEARVILRLGRSTIYRLLREGTIPSQRLGKKILIPRTALAHVERQEVTVS